MDVDRNLLHDRGAAEYRKLFAEVLQRMERRERCFYGRASTFNYAMWKSLVGLGLLASTLAALLAAMFRSDLTVVRDWLIGLPTFSSLCATALHVFKFDQMEALREQGRIELEDEILMARQRQIDAETSGDWKGNFDLVREALRRLDESQHSGDLKARSKAAHDAL